MKVVVLVALAAIACSPPGTLESHDGGFDGEICATTADCHGLFCLVAAGECSGTCVAPPNDGETCDATTAPCAGELVCVDERCVAAKALGESCEPGKGECASPDFCDGDSDVCVEPRSEAERCGYLPVDGPSDFNACASGLKCTVEDASADGVCVVPAELGEACGPTKPCRVGWCDGVCEAPLPAGSPCEEDQVCEAHSFCIGGSCAGCEK